jgi:hypothetical protein
MTKYNGEISNVRARDGGDIDEKEVRIVEMVKGRYTVRPHRMETQSRANRPSRCRELGAPCVCVGTAVCKN